MTSRILVTGVATPSGLALARALLPEADVIAADADPHAPGLHIPGVTARQLPPACDKKRYAEELLSLCSLEQPHALISTAAQELPLLGRLAGRLQNMGVRTWLPSTRTAEACLDHRLLYARGFIRTSPHRAVVITAINAHLSAGFACSTAAGADYLGQLMGGLFGRPIDHSRLRYAPHVRLAQHHATLDVHSAPARTWN